MNTSSHPEFQLAENLVHLNHAAVGPWPRRTTEAVKTFAEENTTFSSKFYSKWLQKETELRLQFKQLLNATSIDDIALVKNTSEALSFVAYGLNWENEDNIVSSNEEFPSNRIPWQSLVNLGVEFRQADLAARQSPEQALFELVDNNTRLLTISSIQFASGLRLDIDLIGQFCKQRNILFCIDAIQSLGVVNFDVQSCQADFVMADGHKWLLGPEGLGVFYTTPASRDKLRLTQYGWHMMLDTHNYENKPWEIHPGAQRFECGSPNMLGIHALSASLELLLETGMESVEKLAINNSLSLMGKLHEISDIEVLTAKDAHLKSAIVVFKHAKIQNNKLYNHLQNNGVLCALRGDGIRFSPHFYNTETELDQAINCILSC
jgi:selenocysteine lyase/cysteine desulfurase